MLLGNYNQWNANPGRALGGVTDPTYIFKAGSFCKYWAGDSSVSGQTEKSSFYSSTAPHYTFAFAPKSGGLTSRRNATLALTPTAALAGGLPGSGSSTITFAPTATGGLIVSGSGTATVTLTPTGTLISVAAGSGTASITLTPTALIGALAGISGQGAVTLSPTATIKAIGYLAGLSTNETEFSADALARAVWDAIATDFNTPGTMGEKLNAASSAGDPWGTALLGAYADGTAGQIVGKKLLRLAQFLALK